MEDGSAYAVCPRCLTPDELIATIDGQLDATLESARRIVALTGELPPKAREAKLAEIRLWWEAAPMDWEST
jgi:hypothetical protein